MDIKLIYSYSFYIAFYIITIISLLCFNYFISPMLVHLKPKKQSKCIQVMQNYIDKVNWNYRLTNPIHCKKNQNSTKIKHYLTQKVSTHGKSISPMSPKYTHYSIDTSTLKKNTKQIKSKQMTDEEKKKNQQWEKSTVVELSTLYKKSFKYNTTIHQILKNLTKNHQSKNLKDVNNHTPTAKDIIKSQPVLHLYESEQMQSPVKLRLKKLQTLKNQCSKLENMDQKQEDRCYHVSQLKFVDQQQGKSTMRASLYQWKSNKPHFTKLKWRRHSITKKKAKNTNQTSGLQKMRVHAYGQNEQNYLDSIFYPASNEEGIFTTYNSNTIDHFNIKQSQKLEQISQKYPIQKKATNFIRTQRSFCLQHKNIQKSLKTMRDHKFSLKAGNIPNPQFSLEAWNTKEKEQLQLLQSILL